MTNEPDTALDRLDIRADRDGGVAVGEEDRAASRYVIYQGVRKRGQAPFWCVLDPSLHPTDLRYQRISVRFTSIAAAERAVTVLLQDFGRRAGDCWR